MSEGTALSAGRATGFGLSRRLRLAIPPLQQTLLGAPLWAVAMGASAFGDLWLRQWETPERVENIGILFAVAGLIAFPTGLFFARLLSRSRSAEVRFAAAFVSFTVITIGLTALCYALQYRGYYSEWHDEAFTVRWVFELVFTTLAACYQFAVMGLPLFFPAGFAALVLAALWFAVRGYASTRD